MILDHLTEQIDEGHIQVHELTKVEAIRYFSLVNHSIEVIEDDLPEIILTELEHTDIDGFIKHLLSDLDTLSNDDISI